MSISVLIFTLTFPYVFCHSMEDAKRLLADKMAGYQKTFRPVANQSTPMEVFFKFGLVSIQEFDEVKEKLTVTALISLVWFDEYMTWNPADYGGMKELVVESEKVWTPNIILINNVDKIEKIGDGSQIIRFTSNGLAFYIYGNVLSSACKADVTYYPLDRHRCKLSFNIWAHSPSEVRLKPATNKVDAPYISKNGAWDFYDSSVNTSFYDYFLHVYLSLERKPRFVLVNVILPVIFMAFLNTLIFLIPIESGERISYCITVLLAIAVFFTLVGDNLPKTSSPMSIFSYYLLTVLIVSICITLSTIFNVRLYYTDDSEEVSRCLARFYRYMKCNCITRSKSKNNKYGKQSVSKSSCNMQQIQYISGPNLPLENADEEVENERKDQTSKLTSAASVSWKDVSAAFDKLFFILSFLILTIATTVLFLLLVLSDRRS